MFASLFQKVKSCFRTLPSDSTPPRAPKMSSSSATTNPNPDQKSTGPEIDALRHWSMYGQPGETPSRKILSTDWKTKAFSKPVTSRWDLALKRVDLGLFMIGFKPREMEDKWFVYAEGPDEKGVVKLCMRRSWTGARIAEVLLSVTRSLEDTVEGEDKGKWQEKEDKDWEARITGLTWESDSEVIRGQEEEGAKETVREVCKWVLGVELPSDNA